MRRTSSAASAFRCRSGCRAPRRASRCCGAASRGERFSFHGKRYDFDDVVIRPGLRAARRPAALDRRDVGGRRRCGRRASAATSCRRARATRCSSRGGEALAASGRATRMRSASASSASCLVTDDPERDWPPVRAAERYRGQLYTRFFAESGRHGRSYARRAAHPPDLGRGRRRALRGGAVGLHRRARDHRPGHLGGAARAPPEQMNASLERFARDVVPRLRAAIESGPGEPLRT